MAANEDGQLKFLVKNPMTYGHLIYTMFCPSVCRPCLKMTRLVQKKWFPIFSTINFRFLIFYLDIFCSEELPELPSVPFILPPDNKSSAITQFNKLDSAVNKVRVIFLNSPEPVLIQQKLIVFEAILEYYIHFLILTY